MSGTLKLAGKVALVTGAGQGIGQGCALELARQGADLLVNDRPGSETLASTVAEVQALGRQCWAIPADVFTRAGCEELVAAALAAVRRIDILISNPAFGLRGAYLDYQPEDFDRVLQGTLTSGFHLSQLVCQHMVERGGGGKVVFISSVVAEMPFARNFAYGTAKAGVNYLTQALAVEMFAHRINVNAIEPGWIDTPGERRTFAAEVIATEGAKLPWGRMGLPADIGCAAAFLASPDADYITGTVLPVDGGFRFKDLRATELPPELKK